MLVLIVDDDQEDIDMLCEAIHQIDTSIKHIEAHNGSLALTLLTTELIVLPDMIFLDINMPIMDGYTCLAEIRKNDLLSTIPVVMYSTTFDKNEIANCLKLGVKAFISKPGNYSKLIEALSPVLH